jgi:thymidylate synthase
MAASIIIEGGWRKWRRESEEEKSDILQKVISMLSANVVKRQSKSSGAGGEENEA